MEYWISVKELSHRGSKRWWTLVVGIVFAVLGVVDLFVEDGSAWPGWIFVAVGTIGVVVALALAFHDVRVERDASAATARGSNGEQLYRRELNERRAAAIDLRERGRAAAPGELPRWHGEFTYWADETFVWFRQFHPPHHTTFRSGIGARTSSTDKFAVHRDDLRWLDTYIANIERIIMPLSD